MLPKVTQCVGVCAYKMCVHWYMCAHARKSNRVHELRGSVHVQLGTTPFKSHIDDIVTVPNKWCKWTRSVDVRVGLRCVKGIL